MYITLDAVFAAGVELRMNLFFKSILFIRAVLKRNFKGEELRNLYKILLKRRLYIYDFEVFLYVLMTCSFGKKNSNPFE